MYHGGSSTPVAMQVELSPAGLLKIEELVVVYEREKGRKFKLE